MRKIIILTLASLVFSGLATASDVTEKIHHKTLLKTNSAAHCRLPSAKLDRECSHAGDAKMLQTRRF